MSTATAPTIPPRPVRAHQQAAAHGANKLPEMPPRPIPKRLDRSVSPANYPRSPLNEPWAPLSKTRSAELAAGPRRPSVQQMPSVGQEGMEYADIDSPPSHAIPTEQTRNIAHDLHLHAPKPSLPKSAAAAQVQAVTRTDSGTAAAHGIGKPGTPGHDDYHEGDAVGRVRSRASFSRPGSSASGNRRLSMSNDEHGPAELGMRVPINPLLGDVQAPSPAPFTPSHTGEKRRSQHARAKSRDGLPPGSYGLHGHGVAPTDPFEKDWYAKHPEEFQHEEAHGHGVYEGIGSGRGAFALSSDDLNKIVRNTASRGAGFGTSGNTMSYPDEQIGYIASDQYTGHGNALTKSLTNVSQPAVESPLRKASVPAIDMDPIVAFHSKRSVTGNSESALDSPQQTPVHIESPESRFSKITGGQESINETAELGPSISRPGTGHGDSDYSIPILAADEVAKESGGDWLQPAVSPRVVDRRSGEFDYRGGELTPTSRPSSRPGSIHGMHSSSYSLSRFVSHHDDRDSMHTPLEDVDEYEPLFPDEETKQKAMSHAERFKQRPDALKHRFPSKDIWEDAPDYGMYQATVSTPDLTLPEDQKPRAAFESPEAEAAGKGERSEAERRKLVQLARLPSHLQDEVVQSRPGLQNRFPSRDIWEDSPDSQHLVTTVSSPPPPEELSPVEAPVRPMVPPRPAQKSKLDESIATSPPGPTIPARPAKKVVSAETREAPTSELKKVPSIPDRPKPQIPPRPAKKPSGESLTKVTSGSSDQSHETERAIPVASPPLTKAKPQVPARPAQSNKFVGLKGNFMNDLNQKLGLGPPKEKEPEPQPDVEAKPLEDARKGRARGPQRRAPAKSPSAPSTEKPRSAMYAPQSLWHIDDGGLLNVGSVEALAGVVGQKGFSAEDESVPVDLNKAQQLENATIADAPPPPTIDTTSESKASIEADKRPEDAPPQMAPNLATNAQGEFADPTLGDTDSHQLKHQATNEAAFLSHQTTESSALASGPELERENPHPNTDAIPASQQTSASTDGLGEQLERHETKAPEEPIELRNEQVSAPNPSNVSTAAADASGAVINNSNDKTAPGSAAGPGVVNGQQQEPGIVQSSSEEPAEPMPEEDVTYEQLEAMQSQADGKELSDGDVKKVVE